MTAMQELAAALERRHVVGMSGEDLVRALAEHLNALPSAYAPVTAHEVEILREYGGPAAVEALSEWSPERESRNRAAVAAERVSALVAGTITTSEAADLLGVDRSRISRRITGGQLWSVWVGAHHRIPSWQIVGGRLLPGLGEVIRAIPSGQSPLSVAAVMHAPLEEFDGRTPIEHLAAGGDVRMVAELVADLGRW